MYINIRICPTVGMDADGHDCSECGEWVYGDGDADQLCRKCSEYNS